MSDSEDDAWDWRSFVAYQGASEVPRNELSRFIAQSRATIQQSLVASLSVLAKDFPTEFGEVRSVRDPDSLAEPLREVLDGWSREDQEDLVIRFPGGMAEFLSLTYDTQPSSHARFGLPIVLPEVEVDDGHDHNHHHPSVPGLLRIALDFDEDVDLRAADSSFYLACSLDAPPSEGKKKKTKKKTSFGKVYYGDREGSRPLVLVADSFEEWFADWAGFLSDEYKGAATDDARKELLGEYYAGYED
ncbi:hypothetical protein HKX48_006909 [Thoreauomyces humboldtii]|nr:hypothetical protein HKX48_006909 [Thoreauomyces humboldtii]